MGVGFSHLGEHWAVNQGDGSSIQFRSPHIICVFQEILKAIAPFYLVSARRTKRYYARGECVPCHGGLCL